MNNPQRCWELWDLLLYDKCVSEPNITLLLDSPLFAVSMKEGRIDRAYVRSDKTEHLYSVGARIYMDCTGDSRLGLEAGAEMRYGREARSDYKESLAPEVPDKETLGSSILFTSKNYGKPMPFTPPKWARKVTKEMVAKRPTGSWNTATGGSSGRRAEHDPRQRADPVRAAGDRDGGLGLHQEQRQPPRQRPLGAWTGSA
ncbi:MAG: FAD-dependent oxidoreductase [Isosphaeraceae bacterium]